jgi:hypothetical protein
MVTGHQSLEAWHDDGASDRDVGQDHEFDAGTRHEVPRVPYEVAIKPDPAPPVPVMALVSFAVLASGLALASSFG